MASVDVHFSCGYPTLKIECLGIAGETVMKGMTWDILWAEVTS